MSAILIREQVIADVVSGLTLTIWRTPDGEGRIRITGDDLPHGNRDLQFDSLGVLVGMGTAVSEPFPSSLRLIPPTDTEADELPGT